jgi:hypothetical protein
MRTVDFETVLTQAVQAIGMDKSFLTEDSFNQIRDFANQRLKYAWEYDAWPELIRITKFTVYHQDLNYIAFPPDNIVTNSQGIFKVDVGTIMQVTIEDPRSKGKVHEIGFSFDETDQYIPGDEVYQTLPRLIVDDIVSPELYVTYKKPCPDLSLIHI